ncbi:MAG: hypothetical protein ACTHKC_06405, partial [Candidatus Nitrosocosmicus sp.]
KDLVKDIDNYVQHVSLHLSKENQRLFAMADIILKDQESQVNSNLIKVEQEKLDKIGSSREHYEKLIDNIYVTKYQGFVNIYSFDDTKFLFNLDIIKYYLKMHYNHKLSK